MIKHERMVFGCCVFVGWIDSLQLAQRDVVAQIVNSVKRHTNLFREIQKHSLWNPIHHHVQEGSGLIPVPCILKMKLVPPSFSRSSYVSSSFWFIL